MSHSLNEPHARLEPQCRTLRTADVFSESSRNDRERRLFEFVGAFVPPLIARIT